MRSWFWFLFPVVLLAMLPVESNWFWNWQVRWAIVVAVLGTWGIWKLKLTVPSVKVFLVYLLLQGLFSGTVSGFHETQEPALVNLLRTASLDVLVVLAAFVAFLWIRIDLTKGLRAAGYVQALGILFSFVLGKNPRYEVLFLHNPSMAATFVALALPTNVFALSSVLLCHSWVAGLTLAVSFLWRFKRVLRGPGFLVIGGLALAGLSYLGHIPDNGRFENWILFWKFWRSQSWIHQVFGLGFGTTRVWMLYVNFVNRTSSEFSTSIWLHSDLFQGLMELGWAGIGLAGTCIVGIFRRAEDRQREGWIALAVAASANMPIHWTVPALIVWNLLGQTLIPRDFFLKTPMRSGLTSKTKNHTDPPT